MKTLITLGRDERFYTFFPPENIELANSLGETVWNESESQWTARAAAERIGESEVYVTAWDCPRLDEEILDHAKNLRLMVHLGGTVIPYVTEAVWDRGIRVISGNDLMAESVAEATVAYMLTAQRRIPHYHRRFTERKVWRETGDFTDSLLGKTVGLVSYGAIPRHLVRMLSPFRVKIKVYDIKPLPKEDKEKYGLCEASLEEIFSTCDIVSLHTPLYDATYHMIDDRLLGLLKKDALLVNTTRGGIVDEAALVKHLRAKDFRAVIDVYEEEPPKADDPLFECENAILIPHMGGPTVNMRAYITEVLLKEAKAFIDGDGALTHEITKDMAKRMSLK